MVRNGSVLENDGLLQGLNCGGIASNKMFYHKANIKCCYQNFRLQYALELNSRDIKACIEEEWIKSAAFNKISYYLICRENENLGSAFLEKQLEELYQEIISSFNIVTTESHVSRFADSLVAAFNNLEKRSV